MHIEFRVELRRKAGSYVRLLDHQILPELKQLAEDAEPKYDEKTRRRWWKTNNKIKYDPMAPFIPEEDRIEPAEGKNSKHLKGFFEPHRRNSDGQVYTAAVRMRNILHQIQTGDDLLTDDPFQSSSELKALCSIAQGLAASSPYHNDFFQGLSRWVSDDPDIAEFLKRAEIRQEEMRTLYRERRFTKIGFDLPETVRAEAQVMAEHLRKKLEEFRKNSPPIEGEEEVALAAYMAQDHTLYRLQHGFTLMAENFSPSVPSRISEMIRQTFAAAQTMAERYGSPEVLEFVKRHEDALRASENRSAEIVEADLNRLREERRNRGGNTGRAGR